MFLTDYVEVVKTHFGLHSIFFFRNSCTLRDDVQKYCRAEMAADGSMETCACILDMLGYKDTPKI